jgi:hypothetical protein
MTRVGRTLLNIALTGLLALAFVALFNSAPFLSQIKGGDNRGAEAIPARGLQPPTLRLPGATGSGETGISPFSQFPGLQLPGVGSLQPGTGQFSARFAPSGGNPAFATKEIVVEGGCEGAGRRYLQQTCPDCPVVGGKQPPGRPNMLMWTDADGAAHWITADCIAERADNRAVVGTIDLAGDEFDAAGDTLALVPLIPGGKRLASMELGGWLTTMDEVGESTNALAAMSAALRSRGWRQTEGQPPGIGVLSSEQRVFTRYGQETCVIYLAREDESVQLITIVSF